jgi:hypothetical protein
MLAREAQRTHGINRRRRWNAMGVLRGLGRLVGGLLAGVFGLLKGILGGLGSLLRRLF